MLENEIELEEMIEQLSEKVQRKKLKIGILGLGYVGFPLALQIIKAGINFVGYDVDKRKIDLLNEGKINYAEYKSSEAISLLKKPNAKFTSNPEELEKVDIYIICVPTPVDSQLKPDLSYIISAADIISLTIKQGNTVILESTVYPGVTENFVGKRIEEKTGLKYGKDFGLANCPERINPGDKNRSIDSIERVLGASSIELAEVLCDMYNLYIQAKFHVVSSIKIAEASKVVENTQRDVNIALINEFALIFEKFGLDVMEVLDAASSKWNFIKLTPGAGVGGHCLPHDPLYLANQAILMGYFPKLIKTAREINDYMPIHIAEKLKDLFLKIDVTIKNSKVLVLGAAYKENVGDIRTSPTEIFINEIKKYEPNLILIDPYVKDDLVFSVRNEREFTDDLLVEADAIVLFTAHDYFINLDWTEMRKKIKRDSVIFIDGRRVFDPDLMEKHYIFYAIGREESFVK